LIKLEIEQETYKIYKSKNKENVHRMCSSYRKDKMPGIFSGGFPSGFELIRIDERMEICEGCGAHVEFL